MKYCRFCGAQLKDGAKFCSVCGNNTRGERAANQLIRRISPDGIQDNPKTNDFLAGIYSAGYLYTSDCTRFYNF